MTRPDAPPDDILVPEGVTAPLCVIIFFSVLNGMMFNVAIPDIAAEFTLLPSQVSWVMTGYILLFGLGSLVYGRLADRLPVRTLITLGLILLNAGSIIGFFSRWYPMVIVARLIQAAGGAAIPALAMLVATKYMPPSIRGKVLGIIAATVSFAAGVGPIAGGFIAGALGWRYLFLVTLLTILSIPALRRMLPREATGAEPFDYVGMALLGTGLTSLFFSVSLWTLWPLPAGGLLLFLFLRHLESCPHPIVPREVFASRHFRSMAITTFLAVGSIFGMMFITPLMLSDVNGLDVTAIGITLFPGALGAALLGTAGGRLADRRGSRFVAIAGMAVTAGGFLLLSTFAGYSAVIVSAVMVVGYIGWALLQSSLPHAASLSMPREFTGVGMGFYNLVFFLSGAFSAALIGRVLDARPGTFCINPLADCAPAWPYSNLFMALAVVTGAALFYFRANIPPGLGKE